MSSNHRTRASRILSLLLVASVVGPAAAAEDPPEWRRRGERAPNEAWDALEGEPAPSLATLTGWQHVTPLEWEDLTGNVVLLVHYEAWQRNLAAEFEHLTALNVDHHPDGLVVLAVHSPRNPIARERFHEAHFVQLAQAVDTGETLASATAVKRYPTYHLVGRDGRVRIAGLSSKRNEDGERYLDLALAAVLDEPYEGERRPLVLDLPQSRLVEEARRSMRRAGGVSKREEAAPLVLGADGWPRVTDKKLHARADLRGEPAPPLVAQKWFGDAPEVEGKCWLAYLFSTADGVSVGFLPKLQRIHAKFGEDLVIAAVSPQAPDAHSVAGKPWANALQDFFVANPEFQFHKGYDGQERFQRAVGAAGLPYALLVDSGGTVRWQGYPFDPKDPLTKKLVGAVIERDARRRAEEAEKKKGGGEGDDER